MPMPETPSPASGSATDSIVRKMEVIRAQHHDTPLHLTEDMLVESDGRREPTPSADTTPPVSTKIEPAVSDSNNIYSYGTPPNEPLPPSTDIAIPPKPEPVLETPVVETPAPEPEMQAATPMTATPKPEPMQTPDNPPVTNAGPEASLRATGWRVALYSEVAGESITFMFAHQSGLFVRASAVNASDALADCWTKAQRALAMLELAQKSIGDAGPMQQALAQHRDDLNRHKDLLSTAQSVLTATQDKLAARDSEVNALNEHMKELNADKAALQAKLKTVQAKLDKVMAAFKDD